jgi:hypothetical protein
MQLREDCGQQETLILAVLIVWVLLPQRHVMAYPKWCVAVKFLL